MTRPTKFEIMRRQRRHVERRRSLDDFEQLKEEARAFGYDHTDEVLCALAEIKPRRPTPAPRRWWWPFKARR